MKLLIVEDSARLRASLEHGLRQEGFVVDVAPDGVQGLAFADTYEYDAIVLDLMLPGLPGLDVLRTLRSKNNNVHILILSAKDRVEDRVQGLGLGADDYLVKPFSFDELCARLKALTRRATETKNPTITVGSLTIDTTHRDALRDGRNLELTASEYALLECLALRRGRTFSQDQLLERLRRSDTEVSSNVVEVLVSSLRRKIDVDGEESIIKTRRGFGYCIEDAE